MKISWLFGILILVLIASACGTSTPAPSAAPPDQPAGPTAELVVPTEVVAPASGSSIDGAALLQERCTVCHSLSRVEAKSASKEAWTTTVERMIGKGAKLSNEEKLALIEYLSVTYHD